MALTGNGPRDALAKNGSLGHVLLRTVPGQKRWGGYFQDWHSLSQQGHICHPLVAMEVVEGVGKDADVLRCGGETVTSLMG